jgi:hypothetical protein
VAVCECCPVQHLARAFEFVVSDLAGIARGTVVPRRL